MRVAIIDYGSGNLRSATKAFERAAREAGIAAEIDLTDRPERVATADRIVLPGVGAYADCRRGLAVVEGMEEALTEAVEKTGRPFFGICVGMQLMSSRGLEKTVTKGFGWIAGDVVGMTPEDPRSRSPRSAGTRLILSARTRCSTAFRPARTVCTPISSIPTTSRRSVPKTWWPRRAMAAR